MRDRGGRSFCRAAALALAAVSMGALAACGRSDDVACDGAATQEQLFAVLRDDYPNKASQEMFARGSSLALDRILKEQGLDRTKPDQLGKAANQGIAEAKIIYQSGHYVLENVATMENGDGGVHSCSGRVVFLTSWGIIVKLVSYDVKARGDGVEVKLTAMR